MIQDPPPKKSRNCEDPLNSKLEAVSKVLTAKIPLSGSADRLLKSSKVEPISIDQTFFDFSRDRGTKKELNRESRFIDSKEKITSPYKRSATQIGQTRFNDAGDLYKEITISGTTYRVEADLLGVGDSFQCYKAEDRFVVKIFCSFGCRSESEKKFFDIDPDIEFNQRMDFLKATYNKAIRLGLSSARVYNIDRLKEDGAVLQELTQPVKITWTHKSDLSEVEKNIVENFCYSLKIAVAHPDNAWDLMPKNFGLDQEGSLKLFDFSDSPLGSNQWAYFHQAILEWIGNNTLAKEMILTSLNETHEKVISPQLKNEIQTLTNKLI